MKNLLIPETNNNPKIELNSNLNKLTIEGTWFRDIETGRIITNTLIKSTEAYLNVSGKQLTVDIKLSLIPTSYSKLLLEFLKFAEKKIDQGKTIEIRWYYDKHNEDMLETGEDFQAVLRIPFRFIEY